MVLKIPPLRLQEIFWIITKQGIGFEGFSFIKTFSKEDPNKTLKISET